MSITLTPLGSYVLSLALRSFPPGQSDLSMVELAECGTDPKAPICAIAPLCDDPADPACKAPRWEPCFHGYRLNKDGAACVATGPAGAWVRNETRLEGAERYVTLAQALADSAEHYSVGWSRGSTDLARALLAQSGWSTGLKKSIQVGSLRGPGGEVCLMDIQPKTLRGLVPWDLSRLPAEKLASVVSGTGYDENRRCFDAGALGLVRMRKLAEQRCKGHPVEFATFALYATGSACVTLGTKERGDWLATPRFNSLREYREQKHTIFPDWWSARAKVSP